MTKYLLSTLYVFLIFICNSCCFAASLNSFAVQPQFLTSGKVNVINNPQNILVDISIMRGFIPNTTTYESVNWTVTVVVLDNNSGNQTLISAPLTITSSDFSGALCSKTISAQVPVNKYNAFTYNQFVTPYNSTVYLRYSPYNFSTSTTSPPQLSTVSYPVALNYVGSGYDPNPGFNGGIVSPVFDGIAVPFPSNQETILLNGHIIGYTAFDWSRLDHAAVNDNIPGTVINFSDVNPLLKQGQSIFSPNGLFRLTLQTDGNLVLYQENGTSETSRWSTLTNNKPGLNLFYQSDGHLVLYNGSTETSPSVWYSNRYDHGGSMTRYAHAGEVMAYPYYKLQDDGNLVFYWPTGQQLSPTQSGGTMRIVFGATDSSSGWSGHQGTLYHPLWGQGNYWPGGMFGESQANTFVAN